MSETKLVELRKPIPIEQVEFRVQSISASGWAIMLAYKDARVDMDRLDQVVGADNWMRLHEIIDGQLFCKVGIYSDDKQQWVWKQDVGVESNTEKEKGRASDAFKRACFNLGIGRELYDYPLILVQLNENEFKVDGNKAKATYDLRLKDWTWHSKRTDSDDHGKTEIKELIAIDEKGNERFKYPRKGGSQQPQNNQSSAPASGQQSQSDDLPWYNDLAKEKGNLQVMVNKGTSPQDLITHLRKTFKVSKKTAAEIESLKPEV